MVAFDPSLLPKVLFSGLAIGMLYFMIASGFSLIFGLEDIVNFAHGSFFMLGAFTAYEVITITDAFLGSWSFLLGLAAGGALIAVLGAAMEVGLLRRKFGHELEIILLTLGVMYIIHNLAAIRWGRITYDSMAVVPGFLTGVVRIGSYQIQKYWLFVIGLGFAIAGSIKLMLERTDLGLIVRAGIDDADMAEAMGANIERTFTIVFAIGCALAGLGGVAAFGYQGGSVEIGLNFLFFAFAIVVIGGLGSFEGSFYAAVLAGLTNQFFAYYYPNLADASLFILMALVLLLRPQGIGGSKLESK